LGVGDDGGGEEEGFFDAQEEGGRVSMVVGVLWAFKERLSR
jgi:hypothetical protein